MGKFVYIKTDNLDKKRTNLNSLINSPMGGFELEVRTSHGGDSMFYSSFTAITVHFDFNLNCLHIIQSIKGMIAHLRGGTKGHGSKYNTHRELQKKRSKGLIPTCIGLRLPFVLVTVQKLDK